MKNLGNQRSGWIRIALAAAVMTPLAYTMPALGQAAAPDPKVTTVSARVIALSTSERRLVTDAGTYTLAPNIPLDGIAAGQSVRLTIGAAKQATTITVAGRGGAAAVDFFGPVENTVRGRVQSVDVANRRITVDNKPYAVAPTVTLDATLQGQTVTMNVADMPVVTALTR